VVLIDTYPDFLLDPDKLAQALTPRSKLLFLNSPANPTGRVMDAERLSEIARVLGGSGVWVVSDDIYDAFDYDGRHAFFAPFYERTLTLGGFSKTAGMTGWRVGYAAGPREVIDAMIRLQQYTFVCSPSFAQYAAREALEFRGLDRIVDSYRKKRDFVYDSLSSRFEVIRPEGAFYFFLKHPDYDGTRVAEEALKKNVLVIPGSVFSERDSHFRISFANSDSELERGVRSLLEIA
jgi:aspartate aminotransferase/aminotransferase